MIAPSLLQRRRMRRRLDAQIVLLLATAEAGRMGTITSLAGGRTFGSAGGKRVGQGGGPWSTRTSQTHVGTPVVDVAGQGEQHPLRPARRSPDRDGAERAS